MNVKIWGFLRIFVIAVMSAGLWSAPGPAPSEAGLAPAIALSHRAERLKAALRSGDPAAVQSAVSEVELLRRTYSTMDVLPLVEAMAVYARGLGDAHHPEAGLEVIRTVERWAPHYPPLLSTRVVLLRQQGLPGALWSMADVFELTRIRLDHPLQRWLWLVQHIAWLRLMVTLLLWSWAFTLALRYRNIFRNLWEEPLLRRGLNAHGVALLGAVLLSLPVVAGLDPSLCAGIWLILMAPFMLPLEVRATILVLVLQWVHPALAFMEPLAARIPEPSVVTFQIRPQAEPVDATLLASLSGEDREYLAGWRHLQFQNWNRAEEVFASLSKTHPDHAEVLNNLGVAHFQMGQVPAAQACFDEAFGLAPTCPEILLNQSVVAFRQMDSALGSAKQELARQVAPEAFSRYMAINQAGNDQRTFPLPLPDSPARIQALKAALTSSKGAAQTALQDQALLLSLLINTGLPLLAVGVFLWRLKRSVNLAHPSQCTRCGEPFHTTDSADASVCSKCHHLFVLKDGLHGESRKKKVDAVAGFQVSQRWIHRMLMVLLPGADRCFMGDTQSGFVELVFLCFATGIVFATGRSVHYPGEILADPASVWLPLGLVLLAVLFVRSWLKLLPRRY